MAIIQIKRGEAADWAVANPILALAELGLETDTNQMKAGDGKTAWSALPYLAESVTRVESVNGESGIVELTKYDIPGIENVDNTTDKDKPVSDATQAAIDALDKTSVGLDQVDNTADKDKPVSDATKAADEALGTFLMNEIAKKADYGDATTNAANIQTNAGNIDANTSSINLLTGRVETLETSSELTSGTPAPTDPGKAGHVVYDAEYIYVCVADNTWKRVAIATW